MDDRLSSLLETTTPERLATGFVFTEGSLWHPDGFYTFVDIRRGNGELHRITPGKAPELVRKDTGEGNGTTFDLEGRFVMCEGGNRRVTRTDASGQLEVLADRFEGKRFNRPNDVVCKSDGSLWFTDPGYRVPMAQRELAAGVPDGMKVDVEGRVYCTGPGGTWVFAPDGKHLGTIRTPEYPANVAFGGPDLKTLFFTANTSIYTLRMKVPGQPHPWYRRAQR